MHTKSLNFTVSCCPRGRTNCRPSYPATMCQCDHSIIWRSLSITQLLLHPWFFPSIPLLCVLKRGDSDHSFSRRNYIRAIMSEQIQRHKPSCLCSAVHLSSSLCLPCNKASSPFANTCTLKTTAQQYWNRKNSAESKNFLSLFGLNFLEVLVWI